MCFKPKKIPEVVRIRDSDSEPEVLAVLPAENVNVQNKGVPVGTSPAIAENGTVFQGENFTL